MAKKKIIQLQQSHLQSFPPPITDNHFDSEIRDSLLIPDLLELDELDEQEYDRREDFEEEDDEDIYDFDALDLLEPSLLFDTIQNYSSLDSYSDSSMTQSTSPQTIVNISEIIANQFSLLATNYSQTNNNNNNHNNQIIEHHKIPKKRIRKPLTQEYRQRRNQKRRMIHRLRVITSDFASKFMLMAENVFNSCDISYFGSFIHSFFDINMMYSTYIKKPDRFLMINYGRGSDKLYNSVNDGYQTSPDIVYTNKQTKYQYYPQTKQTIITSRMRCDATRNTIINGEFSQIMIKLQALANLFQCHTCHTSNIQQLVEENQQINSLFTPPTTSTTSTTSINSISTSNPGLHRMEENPWIDIEAYKGLLHNKRLYLAIQQILSLPKHIQVSLSPWFPSGIKLTTDYIHRFYISEHGKVQRLELYLETMKLELSKHDLMYYDERNII